MMILPPSREDLGSIFPLEFSRYCVVGRYEQQLALTIRQYVRVVSGKLEGNRDVKQVVRNIFDRSEGEWRVSTREGIIFKIFTC